MKMRCSPYKPLLCAALLGIFILCNQTPARAQCHGDFSYETFSTAEASPSGRIEVSIKDPEPGTYIIKLYKLSGKLSLVETKETVFPDKIIFEGLPASSYFVKIEWAACSRVIGGLEGISITAKDEKQ